MQLETKHNLNYEGAIENTNNLQSNAALQARNCSHWTFHSFYLIFTKSEIIHKFKQ